MRTTTPSRLLLTPRKGLGVPLKVVRDTYQDGRKAYEAKLILVRPDRYVAWASDCAPRDAKAIVGKAIGHA